MHDKVNNRSAGTLIGLLAALVGLLCFFLPWLEANLFGQSGSLSALVALVGGALNLRPARQAGPLSTPAMTGDASLASASAPATFANPPVMNPPMPFSAPAAATKGSPRMICSKCGKPIPATGRFC